MVTFEHWDDGGYVYYNDGNQVAAGLYSERGFELMEETGITQFGNGMQAFSYLKAKYVKNSQPLKQSTIDLFAPRERSDSKSGAEQRAIAARIKSSLKSTHPVLYPEDPELRNTDWTHGRSDRVGRGSQLA